MQLKSSDGKGVVECLPASISGETLERLIARGDVRANQSDMEALHQQISTGIESCRREINRRMSDNGPDAGEALATLRASLDQLQLAADGHLRVIREGASNAKDRVTNRDLGPP